MDSAKEISCPGCGMSGKRIKTITLSSLLHPVKMLEIGMKNYFFCGSPHCNIVYFAEDGSRTFSRKDLVVRVGAKESSPPRPACYCFNHSREDIFNEVERTGQSTVVADIRKRMAEEGCSCDTKNPAGNCCLGTVQGYVREAFARFKVKGSATGAKDND